MKTVLFIILPYPSHYNASFGLARDYQSRGFQVVFTGYAHLQDHVEQQGYAFCSMHYTTEYQVRSLKNLVSSFLISLLERKDVAKRYREWYGSVVEVRKLCEHYHPEQILIDAHLSHYYLYLFDYRKMITMLSTKLSTKKSPGLPPLNSFYVPNDTRLSHLICEYLWIKYTTGIGFKNLKKKIAFLSKDEVYFQKRLCKQYHLCWHDVFEQQNTFFIGLKNVPTVILGSEALDFPRKRPSPYESYKLLPIQRNEEASFSDQYRIVREKLQTLKDQANASVIYCSFGTLSRLNSKSVSNFIRKLVVAIQQQNVALVIATGGLPLRLDAGGERLFVLKQVPQLDMLSLSDMMITHGGHNSIKECLQAQVPMLIYPLNLKVDQPGNAVRVYAAGYGLFGKMDQDSSKEMLNKVHGVLAMKKGILGQAI